jgi:hypothetical protein
VILTIVLCSASLALSAADIPDSGPGVNSPELVTAIYMTALAYPGPATATPIPYDGYPVETAKPIPTDTPTDTLTPTPTDTPTATQTPTATPIPLPERTYLTSILNSED